ncbi:MAG: T9SS type A sorting domain-containing protein [Bacteroidetes bacterium]|nr:T9SS type A sorting domain-containing protein [Bacteroidota bacterium]
MKKITNGLFSLLLTCLVGSNLNAQTPFWSEDFAGQIPADWTAIMDAGNGNASSNWVWTNVGPTGPIPTAPLASTTAANGWMIFDSDLNCSGNQDVSLISPKLDLSGRNQVFLEFETLFRRFNDQTTLLVSTDSVNWTELTLFGSITNTQYGDGQTSIANTINPQTITMDISANAANQSQFWFGFRFLADSTTVMAGTDIGCGYSWQIDDVALYDTDLTPSLNIAIGDFFFPPASFAQPESQIKSDTMGFFADLSNLGSEPVTNVVLKAQVRQGSAVVWSDSIIIDVLDTNVADSTFYLDNQFIPDMLTQANNYSIRYTAYSLDGDDEDLSDNSRQEAFVVTDNLYSKENGITTAYRPGGGPSDWAVANVYQTSKNWVDQYKASSATMRLIKDSADGAFAGNQVSVGFVEIDDNVVDVDWNGFDDASPYYNNASMILKSVNIYDFTQNTQDVTITQDITDFDDLPVALEPGKRYVLIAEYQGAMNNTIYHGFSEDINYFQISTLVYTDQWYLGGFGPEPAASLRLTIDLYSTADEVSLPDNSLTFYPNPASTNLNVDINLDEPTLANITLADLNGRVIQIDEVENAFQEKRQYDVSSLPNGTYIVRIATKTGTKTKKFVVQH